MEIISYDEIKELKFKGTQVAYAIVCERKLWLFSKGIALEHTSDRVNLGKLIDETSFKSEEGYRDENVSIDFITSENGIIVHEVKLSKALEDAHLFQIKYYIYYLRKKGINALYGILHYPKMKKIRKVEFTEDDEIVLKKLLSGIENVLSLSSPPALVEKPYCKKCAYFEFCYG